jgi:ATP-dependent protease ClpP protease subunit
MYRMKMKGAPTRTAEILIYEDIGADWFGEGLTAKQFAADLRALGDVKQIDLRINSYGGDVFDGLTIYNLLKDHKAEVTTHIDGIAASIASVIAMAGNRIRIAENGFFMIHDAWGMQAGNAADMRAYAERLEAVSGQLASVYAARTRRKVDEVKQWMAGETWMDSGTAIDRGFADEMAENQKMAASYNPARHHYRNMPRHLAFNRKEAARGELSARHQALQQRITRKALGQPEAKAQRS